MFPIIHLLASIIAVIFLYPIYRYWSLAFFIGGFLIDVDHYIWYVLRTKSFSFKEAYNYSLPENREKREKDVLHIFHVWEFWVVMIFLAFLGKFFFIILLGLILHISLDLIELAMHPYKKDERAMSLIGWLKRHSKKR